MSSAASSDRRTLALWCPDWPVVAAGLDPATDTAVTVHAGRVTGSSFAARHEGVRRGMRLRDAQRCCPDLVVLPTDPGHAGRVFEPVVEAIADLVPSVEVVRPGLCGVPVRRAARYFGSETRLATRLVSTVRDHTGIALETGIADGIFAATLAAQRGAGAVPPGDTAAFLAPLPIGVLDRPAFTSVLGRLGIHTLGALAALPAGDVLNRFGGEGAWAHHLASATHPDVRNQRVAPADYSVQIELDPPLLRVDAAAFVARGLAQQLHERLHQHGLMCLRISVEAETESGELLQRMWRHDGSLSSSGLADRVRWQLDGWLSGGIASRDGSPRGGVSVLRLVPDQFLAADGRQGDLLTDASGDAERDERVDHALTRVQALLGHTAVVTAVVTGGRDPHERIRLIPWTDPRTVDEPPAVHVSDGPAPWPGQLPDPPPATVLVDRPCADVHSADGQPITINGRSRLSSAPARISVDQGPWRTLTAWAGPWSTDVRWWDALTRRRRARFQVVCDDGSALLLSRENERWYVDAFYD